MEDEPDKNFRQLGHRLLQTIWHRGKGFLIFDKRGDVFSKFFNFIYSLVPYEVIIAIVKICVEEGKGK